MKKVMTIVGARPQFIKAAAVSRIIRQEFEEILVHTGQHYDPNMSDIFFSQLSIPTPNYNLEVGSGSHAKQTAEMLVKIEELILKEQPDCLLVYGDTNSTLAGALAASKIHTPIVHVEAGLRSFNMRMPEEQNRILTDKLSTILFCPTQVAVQNLTNENITKNVFNVGDVMFDAVLYYSKGLDKVTKEQIFEKIVPINEKTIPNSWYLATVHRAENTDSIEKVRSILQGLEALDHKVIFPVHPRTLKMVLQCAQEENFQNLVLVEPIGYTEMLYLTKNAVKVVTDSGGLQKEAYMLDTSCVTVRDQTEWVETLVGNNNILCKPNKESIIKKVLHTEVDKSKKLDYYGGGKASQRIFEILKQQI